MIKASAKYYIGLMSGTSADGIDLALVEFTESTTHPKLLASYYQAYSPQTAEKITSLYLPNHNEIDRAFELDVELAHCFSKAITELLSQENLTADDIIAIGSHGQTIRHRPLAPHPFTLQIGCCQTLACLTGIRVIGQFRVKDIALGGQGAPLVPAFHQQIFSEPEDDVFVVNIGGIANISFLPAKANPQAVIGFDTGPGNALLDEWFKKHHINSIDNYDRNGAWAQQGQVNLALLKQLLSDDYFKLEAPKSTGREYFHLTWLTKQLEFFDRSTDIQLMELSSSQPVSPLRPQLTSKLMPQDIQATLTAFTAITIANDIKRLANKGKVYLCGGGTHNQQLVDEIDRQLSSDNKVYDFILLPTSANNIDGDLLEAIAFSWLAYAFDNNLESNIPSVTGASRACCLGTEFIC